MVFPQGLGCVEYTLNVLLKGKKKFGSAKKWNTTLVLKVEVSRRAIGARLEQMAIADAVIGKTKHMIMVSSLGVSADDSLNILGLFSLGTRIIILHCTSLRDYCKYTPLRQRSSNDLSTKLSVGTTVAPPWSVSYVE